MLVSALTEEAELPPDSVYRGTPPLARAYRWCLKAYPKSYWTAVGDDLVGLIADLHAGEDRASGRECLSIVRAGLARRARMTRLRYFFPVLLLLQSAAAFVFIGLALRAVLEQRPAVGVGQPFTAYVIVLRLRTSSLLAYVLPLVVVAVLLSWLGVRAIRRVRTTTAEQPRLSKLDAGAVLAQPLMLLAAAVGPFIYRDVSASETASAIAALVLGLIVIVFHRGQLRHRFLSAAVLVALALVALPWLAVGVAGDHFGPSLDPLFNRYSNFNFAAGFTDQIAVSTGRSLPVSVVCPAQGHCFVYGAVIEPPGGVPLQHFGVFAVTTNGTTWRAEPFPANSNTFGETASLACPTITSCYLRNALQQGRTTGTVARTSNGGRTWVALPASSPSLAALACPAVEFCVGTASTGIAVTHDGGESWTTVVSLRVDESLRAISCADARDCAVVENQALKGRFTVLLYTTRDGGTDWVRHVVAVDVAAFGAELTCPTAIRCLVGGETVPALLDDVLWTTNDGGRAWAERSDLAPFPVICPSARACWSLEASTAASTVLRSDDSGLSWDRTAALPRHLEALNLACPTPLSCTVVGFIHSAKMFKSVIVSTANGGRTWSETLMPQLPLHYRLPPSLLN